MNRPIKFRAKRVDNGEWVYGCYCRCIEAVGMKKSKPAIQETDENGLYFREIDLNTLGQFTGLCDKNGKEIYEGDIVHCWDTIAKCEIWAVVEFGNPNAEYTWGWQLRKIKGSKGVNLDILCWVECEETNAYCEIIGNIHDNPELLKGE